MTSNCSYTGSLKTNIHIDFPIYDLHLVLYFDVNVLVHNFFLAMSTTNPGHGTGLGMLLFLLFEK